MKLGRFTIEQLSEGQFEVFDDGTFAKLDLNETEKTYETKLKDRDSTTLGIDPILVSDDEHHILLDAGLGWGLDYGSSYRNSSNVKTNLEIFGVRVEDITHVILSHLHYDHAAGSTFTDSDIVTQPTFPNARYYLHRKEWEYAVSQIEQKKILKGAGYKLDDFYRLVADDRIAFLDEDIHHLIPGLKVLWTGGHTPGHLAVRIYDDGKSAYYLGDLLPGDNHLNRYTTRQKDLNPVQAKKKKIQLMRKACDENAFLLFYHSLYSKSGRLEKDDQSKYILKEL